MAGFGLAGQYAILFRRYYYKIPLLLNACKLQITVFTNRVFTIGSMKIHGAIVFLKTNADISIEIQ